MALCIGKSERGGEGLEEGRRKPVTVAMIVERGQVPPGV